MDKFPCKNWDINNMMCLRHAKALVQCGKLRGVILSEQDFDKDCSGYSNKNLCCWFVYSHESIKDFQQRVKREGVKHG